MREKTVFISYSHDSQKHRRRVLALAQRLRRDGIKTILDQYVSGSPHQGWPRWMLDQLDAADAVLVVCSESYYRRFRGHEVDNGKGVDWEGALITHEIYASRSRTLKFVPVFLSTAVEEWIPEPLRSVSHYARVSEGAYKNLYDFLLEQTGVEPQPIGALRVRPGRRAATSTFSEPPPLQLVQPNIPPATKCDWTPKAVRIGLNHGLLEEHIDTFHFSAAYTKHLCCVAQHTVEFELQSFVEHGWIRVLTRATVAATRVPIGEDDLCYFISQASGLPLASYVLSLGMAGRVFVQRSARYHPAPDLTEEFVEICAQATSEISDRMVKEQADVLAIRTLYQVVYSRFLLNNPQSRDYAYLVALFIFGSWKWNDGIRQLR